ncbi:C6 transcription factor [Aspergillus nomiae NRRL 13137]|uniref:C6 transcription factor n=1 Tax=Aspergillus nomiae NRRL (strain ATCC 15546 / NRRL 13137 / CBS 260.88 / M93) TaxID=1509407 RepID=A0A0L1ISF4_ASPN3|nr:C6 transcription factor [Aspergillus nomiae NRRL 13137]KNG82491.1 C6 transcription factor [Aspergillus nomiae NRRL 13137]
MDSTSTSSSHSRRATRSSLACLPCRSRHVKCDGKRPCCARCTELGQECSYARSRRGGLDRAALADRRQRLAAGEGTLSTSDSSRQSYTAILQVQGHSAPLMAGGLRPEPSETISVGDVILGISYPGASTDDIENDPLIKAYYEKFHGCHPFLLPQKHLTRLYQDPQRQSSFTPLLAAMRLIGSIYTSREWPVSLRDQLEACFLQASPSDPIIVQSRFLLSIALFWYDYKDAAKQEMDAATGLALELKMFLSDFAASHGGDDPVLRECWRRTWWMLYTVDAYYTGTLGTMNFRVANISPTVELPCEELEYESGDIPEPRTLQEFNCREFSTEPIHFSSFAYLIGAVQCAAAAISAAPKIATKEDSTHVIQAADSSLDGWRLLLPNDRKQVMDKNGKVDELMFQAHLLIHVSAIGLHRPFSALKFNAVEDISSCAREPPLDTPIPDLVNVHTVRVLRAVEAQIRLLALPLAEFHHTPFTTCMVSEGTLALLSACATLLKGTQLSTARDQIRMTLGCLKVLGEVWPRIARNVRELQTIAQTVLGIGAGVGRNTATPSSSAGPSFGGGEGGLDLATYVPSNDTTNSSSLGSIEDLCGWYS